MDTASATKKLHGFFFVPPIDKYFIGDQAKEIYKDQIYAPYLRGKKDLTILDIGANLGLVSYYLAPYAKVIYAFEPALEAFMTLNYMVTFNELTNIIPIQKAVSNADGQANFYHIVENKTMNSLNPIRRDEAEKETVQTIRLDTFFKEKDIQHVDIMKLDIEGGEADVICGDGFANIADKIDVVIGETHTWMGRNPFQFKDALENLGFTYEIIPGEATLFVAKRI